MATSALPSGPSSPSGLESSAGPVPATLKRLMSGSAEDSAPNKRPKGIKDTPSPQEQEPTYTQNQVQPRNRDQPPRATGPATPSAPSASRQNTAAASQIGQVNLDISTSVNPDTGQRTATCPLPDCRRTYEGPNSKRICRSHVTEFHQLRRPRPQESRDPVTQQQPRPRVDAGAGGELYQLGRDAERVNRLFKSTSNNGGPATSSIADYPGSAVPISHCSQVPWTVPSPTSPAASSRHSQTPEVAQSPATSTGGDAQQSDEFDADQGDIADSLNLELAQQLHPQTGQPYCICPWPGCGKQYDGINARSICRRHVANIHKVALSKQPRKSRWDSDRPQTEEERRLRTLNSKRKWAQKNRARKKEEAERESQEAATNAALELASLAGSASRSSSSNAYRVASTTAKQEDSPPQALSAQSTPASVGQLLAPPQDAESPYMSSAAQHLRTVQGLGTPSSPDMTKGQVVFAPYAQPSTSSAVATLPAHSAAPTQLYKDLETQTPKATVPQETDEQVAKALLDFMSSPTKPGETDSAETPAQQKAQPLETPRFPKAEPNDGDEPWSESDGAATAEHPLQQQPSST